MASCEPSSQSESPQPSCCWHFPEETVDEEIPGPPAPWVEPSPQLQSRGRKRVWSAAFEEDLAPESKDTRVVESLRGLTMKLNRLRISSALPEHHEVFNRLLEDPAVRSFLAWDKDYIASDKYLLSMVIAYFSRVGLFSWQFRPILFFVALYLANDMEEDNLGPKQAILWFLYGMNYSQRVFFQKLRFQFFLCMGWNASVTREECEEIQAYDPEHWVWGRDRALLP